MKKSPLIVSAALLLSALPALAVPSTFFTPDDRDWSLTTRIVSAPVFHWFESDAGQQLGSWRPIEGRPAWDGSVGFWEGQIKDIMSANVDLMYVHQVAEFGADDQLNKARDVQRANLLRAARNLRGQGYKTPKIAPFSDPFITFSRGIEGPIDLATTAGKDKWVGEYRSFYNQYFATNDDPFAADFLGKIDSKPMLNSYVNPADSVLNNGSLTRSDVESRLRTSLAGTDPDFNNGVHLTRLIASPAPTFADERIAQFEVNEHTVLYRNRDNNGVWTRMIKPGFWVDNLPGNQDVFLPRDGGSHYREAWQAAQANKDNGDPLYRVQIESWNEYDESSGIYAANTEPFYSEFNTEGRSDTWWSGDNPYGGPRAYINFTADAAAAFNDVPELDADILFEDLPDQLQVGERATVTFVIRNEGDESWNESKLIRLGQMDQVDEAIFIDGGNRVLIDPLSNEIPEFGGVFRGRPIFFTFDIVAPDMAGEYVTNFSMVQDGVTFFGENVRHTFLVVVPEPATAALIAAGVPLLLRRRRMG